MSRVNCPQCGKSIWAGAVACKSCDYEFRATKPPTSPVYYRQPVPPVVYPNAPAPPLPVSYYPQTPPHPAYTPSDFAASIQSPYPPPPSPSSYYNRPPVNVEIIPRTKALLDSELSGDGINVIRWCACIIVGTVMIIRVILFSLDW